MHWISKNCNEIISLYISIELNYLYNLLSKENIVGEGRSQRFSKSLWSAHCKAVFELFWWIKQIVPFLWSNVSAIVSVWLYTLFPGHVVPFKNIRLTSWVLEKIMVGGSSSGTTNKRNRVDTMINCAFHLVLQYITIVNFRSMTHT